MNYNMLDYFLITYFLVNFFLVGGYFFSRVNEVSHKRQAVSLNIATLLLLVIATPMAILSQIYYVVIKRVDEIFQITFFLKFLFTNRYDNMEEYILKRFNRLASAKNKDKLSDRIYIYGVRLMNKRNNYVYVESEDKDKGELYSRY